MIIQIISRFRLSSKWKKTDPGEIVAAISIKLITFEQLPDDYRGRGTPEEFFPISVGMERTIATNALARGTAGVIDLTGTRATASDAFVRNALAD